MLCSVIKPLTSENHKQYKKGIFKRELSLTALFIRENMFGWMIFGIIVAEVSTADPEVRS